MIRRISKHNDLKDIIKSCPSGVIDDIYAIEYYIQGNNVTITASFTKVGNELVVVLPTSQLELLPNGILMRRAFYKVVDTTYPDGYYNLEFEDNMNIWLGDYESEEPVIPEYVTEDSLSSTLSSYATQDWVDSQQFLTSETIPSDIATESYVTSALSGYATQGWVRSQGYLTAVPSEYVTVSWVSSQQFAAQSWVSDIFVSKYEFTLYSEAVSASFSFLRSELSSYATREFVTSALSSYATASKLREVEGVLGDYIRAVESEVSLITGELTNNYASIGYVDSSISEVYSYVDSVTAEFAIEDPEDPFATWQYVSDQISASIWDDNEDCYIWDIPISYIQSQIDAIGSAIEDLSSSMSDITSDLSSYATQDWVEFQGYLTAVPSEYATQDWVLSQSYLTSVPSEYATQDWVLSQSYLTSVPSEYATHAWVSSQGYLTAETIPSDIATESFVTSALSGYATEAWVLSQSYITVGDLPSGLATQSWVQSQGYLTSVPSEYATQSWVSSNFCTTSLLSLAVNDLQYSIRDLSSNIGVLSESVSSLFEAVGSIGYNPNDPFVTESWVYDVMDNIYSDMSSEIEGVQSWVESQGYLTSVPSEYATESWVSSNYLAESKIWTGTQSDWEQLTSAQQAFYTIALVTE